MSKTMNEIFSTNFRNALYLAGKTQADLARATGVSETSVSNWKDLYQELDDEHRRSFWRSLIKEVKIDENGKPVEILY